MAPIIPTLHPLPPPGLTLFHGFTARQQEALIVKEQFKHFSRSNLLVAFKGPDGGPGQMFLEIDEVKRRRWAFKSATTGEVVMNLVKEKHCFHPHVYHGMAPDGTEMWTLVLKRHSFSGTEYCEWCPLVLCSPSVC